MQNPWWPCLKVSSLERKQRKNQDRQDVLAFYSSLGFLFFIVTGVLLWSEIYAFATHPDKALTVSFVLEVLRLLHVVCLSVRSGYVQLGELAWTLTAVIYGPSFHQKGAQRPCGAQGARARRLGRIPWW